MAKRDIIVVGASAGGIEPLLKLAANLPADLPAAIFVVLHVPMWGKSRLPRLLNDQGGLEAAFAVDHEAISFNRIYVAPPNYHLLVKQGYVRLVQGPKENGFRPAVDPLFRTAAKVYGQRVIGVVLSGALDDGTAGLIDVKQRGGLAVVQDPDEALFSSMPKNAIENVAVDHVLSITEIASLITELQLTEIEESSMSQSNDSDLDLEPDITELDGLGIRTRGTPGTPSGFICPDCGGSLYQMHERDFLQFRCRVGHAWSAGSLVVGQAEALEASLWDAIRSLEERAALLLRLADDSHKSNRSRSATRFEAQAQDLQQRADGIRQILFQGQLPPTTQQPNQSESPSPTQPCSIVIFAAAEGGLAALSQILPALPPDFAAAVVVVQKLDPQSSASLIADALFRPTTLLLKLAEAGEILQRGVVYVTPPNQHVLVNSNGRFSLTEADLVGFTRPSADLLLQSAAASFKQRAMAVILSGLGDDGVAGIQAIHQMGGRVIVQDETTCEFTELPQAAIQTETVDWVLPLTAIATTLVDWVTIANRKN